jgi:hypothetical protein
MDCIIAWNQLGKTALGWLVDACLFTLYEPAHVSLWNSGYFQRLASPATGFRNPKVLLLLEYS